MLAERFSGTGGGVRWTNYIFVGGRMIGVFIQKADETTATRYFHTDHLGSIAVITNETGGVVERLSYDAWGLRRHEDGTPDPAGSITSEAERGFTGHEHLAEVGLIHMNGRVYDPLLGRFGTPRPHGRLIECTPRKARHDHADPSGLDQISCPVINLVPCTQ